MIIGVIGPIKKENNIRHSTEYILKILNNIDLKLESLTAGLDTKSVIESVSVYRKHIQVKRFKHTNRSRL